MNRRNGQEWEKNAVGGIKPKKMQMNWSEFGLDDR